MKTAFVVQKSGTCGDRCRVASDGGSSPRQQVEQMIRQVDAMSATLERQQEQEIRDTLKDTGCLALKNTETGAVAVVLPPRPHWQAREE